mmetsp:Transcript_29932/g.72557  ORF Transcript_29932/g.72557 Transcript_29932/m.72557 type:complete len:287 (+) Transcript_29932:40-900(+)
MTQKGLIDKVLAASRMTDCNPTCTPAAQIALRADPQGDPFNNNKWNYASIVGMLLYLANNTRPDICYAVSQAARYMSAPKASHGTAVQRILRYLKGTRTDGIVVAPTGDLHLKLYVDADFAGLFGQEPSSNIAAAKSRLGFIITLGSIPVLWRSTLLSKVCLSTLEAEYCALSTALRTLIPIREVCIDLVQFFRINDLPHPIVLCTVFEDNQGAYLLATSQRLSARTRYFCVDWHFFWSYVYDPDTNPTGWLVIKKVATLNQWSDYLTKGLPIPLFRNNRKAIQGF